MTYLAFAPSASARWRAGVGVPLEILTRTPALVVARIRLEPQ